MLCFKKEGFDPLLAAARIADRYDIAMFSTKGQSVIAARKLTDELSQRGVTILVCHNFDKYGLEILYKLRTNTWRYRFAVPPKVIDLGLRLADVQAMHLQSKPGSYPSGNDPRINLRACGATEEECQF